jgi:uncharacterized protein YecT (DUF1311 family)
MKKWAETRRHRGAALAGAATAIVVMFFAPAQAQDIDCHNWPNKSLNQHEMNMCQERDYQAADAQLNAAYRALTGLMTPDMRTRLVAAQRAWVQFRDRECAFETADSEGGSMHPLVHYGCLARLTKVRTRELREHARQRANP